MPKKLLKGALIVLGVVGLGFAGLLVTFFASTRPTHGPRVPAYSAPRTALLVVDIQEDFTGPQAKKPYRDGARILAVSNKLLARAGKEDFDVVYIQNVIDGAVIRFLAGGVNAACAPGTDMDHRLLQVPGAPTFVKHRADAFSNPELDAYLRKRQVDHVVIVGLDAAYCVNATTQGALNRGYRVTLATDGIATETGKAIADLARSWRKLGAEVVEMPPG